MNAELRDIFKRSRMASNTQDLSEENMRRMGRVRSDIISWWNQATKEDLERLDSEELAMLTHLESLHRFERMHTFLALIGDIAIVRHESVTH